MERADLHLLFKMLTEFLITDITWHMEISAFRPIDMVNMLKFKLCIRMKKKGDLNDSL